MHIANKTKAYYVIVSKSLSVCSNFHGCMYVPNCMCVFKVCISPPPHSVRDDDKADEEEEGKENEVRCMP